MIADLLFIFSGTLLTAYVAFLLLYSKKAEAPTAQECDVAAQRCLRQAKKVLEDYRNKNVIGMAEKIVSTRKEQS